MSLDSSKKHRYCGYCRQDIHDYLDIFLQHLNYCELALVYKSQQKKKEDNGNGVQETEGNPQ